MKLYPHIGEMIWDTVDTALAGVEEEIDEPALAFTLRTVRQLLLACKDQNETFRSTLENADLDEDTRQRLVEVGYRKSSNAQLRHRNTWRHPTSVLR